MLTWESGSSHGSDNAVVVEDCNYNNQEISFLYHVISQITLLEFFFDDIRACDLSKEKTLWTKTVPLQSTLDEKAIFDWLKTPAYIFEGLPVWSVSHPRLRTALCLLSVFLFATLKSSQIFTELLLITAFPSQLFFDFLLISISSAVAWFCSVEDHCDKKI